MSQTLQQIIQASLDSVRSHLNTPGNSYYLPTWLSANGYDPYGKTVAMNWPFTLGGADILNAASNICGDIQVNDSSVCASEDDYYIGDPSNPPTLTLGGAAGDLLIQNFSNATITSLTVTGDVIPMTITALLTFSTIPNLPPSPTVQGNFSLVQHCCCSTDQSTCIAKTPSVPCLGSGTFVATITGSCTATATVKITDLSKEVLDFSVTQLALAAPLDKSGAPNISAVIKITDFSSNMPPKAQDAYNNLAEEAFNSSAGRIQILKQINTIMNVQEQLDAIGTALTKIVDGYLKANNQYPFGNASLSLY